ncbi:MAG: DUF4147 domain-containing protein [Methylobacteriaceae bacterium]|nr:DUF4147 domain-containing protein [Methylobacteriaceae bacterium]
MTTSDRARDSPHRELLRGLYEEAVAAAHPSRCLPGRLPAPPASGRMIVLAAGKAAGSMAHVTEAFYRDRIGRGRIAGIAVARHGYGVPLDTLKMIEAGHPVPDQAGIEATGEVMALAASASAEDFVLVLLSGGGSANWIAPAGALTLAEKQGITRALLRSGAPIGEINCVRKHLSRIKGGRLARLAAPARLLTLAISDVPGNDPSAIASGPTVPDPTTLADARTVLQRRDIPLSASAEAILSDPAMESPKPGDLVFAQAEYRVIATAADSLASAAARARGEGYEVLDLGADVEGEARDVAAAHARLALDLARAGRRAAILSGGELTVTIRGRGRGGPNQEYALALALALDGAHGIAAVAGDTDGTDGGGGSAGDPAGAFIDATTLARAKALGRDVAAFLADNDSTGFFEALGDLLRPGPTRTNVNDLRAIVIEPGQE